MERLEEIHTVLRSKRSLTKVLGTHTGERIVFLINVAGKVGYPHAEE
jgi:hypothetical protein